MQVLFDFSLIGSLTKKATGGVVQPFYYAKLLSDNGIETRVATPEFPKYVEDEFEAYHIPKVEKAELTIVPEVFFHHYNNSGKYVVPFIWESWLVQPTKIQLHHPCLSPTPFVHGVNLATGFDSNYVPIFIWTHHYQNLPDKTIDKATIIINPRKKPISTGLPLVLSGKRPQVLDKVRKTKVFIYPATHEGFGLPILEAMASEAVVFVVNNKGNTGFIRDGVNGYLFDSREELEYKLENYDPYVGVIGRQYVMDYFSDRAVANEVVRVFQKLLD